MTQNWAEQINMGARSQCLWIYGQPGSGKSYLVKQLHEWASLNKRLVHVNVASFFQEWRQALNNNDALSFIRKYRRDTDILILENIDDLQGKTGTQQEVLLTISALLDKGASVVVSSSTNPVMLREILPPALFSRLFSGLSFEMPAPDRPFKERLWRSLIEQNGLTGWPIDIRVLDRIFSLPLETPRKVHTFFINVIGRLSLTKQLSLSDLQEIEALHGPRRKNVVESQCLNPTELIERVSNLCGVSLSALQGDSRRQDITMARRFVCLSLSRFLGLTNAVIAQYLEKDPSAISRALNQLEEDIEKQRHIAKQWNWLCDELGIATSLRG
jgi:chromosomal replication initiator protein